MFFDVCIFVFASDRECLCLWSCLLVLCNPALAYMCMCVRDMAALAFELWGPQGPHGSSAAEEVAGGCSSGGRVLGSGGRGLLDELASTLSPKPRRLLEELASTHSPRRGRDAGDSEMSGGFERSADERSDFSRFDGLSQNWGEGRGWEVVSKDFLEFERSAEMSLVMIVSHLLKHKMICRCCSCRTCKCC